MIAANADLNSTVGGYAKRWLHREIETMKELHHLQPVVAPQARRPLIRCL